MNWGITEENSLEYLKVIFPQLSPSTIVDSIQHPSNRDVPFNEGRLIQRCIDDLLELRTQRQIEGETINATSDNYAESRDIKGNIVRIQEQVEQVVDLTQTMRHNLNEIEARLATTSTAMDVAGASSTSAEPVIHPISPASTLPAFTPLASTASSTDGAPAVNVPPPSPPRQKSAENILQEDMLQVYLVCVLQRVLFPKVDPDYVRQLFDDVPAPGDNRVNLVCNWLLELNYPKSEPSTVQASTQPTALAPPADYYETSEWMSDEYRKQCLLKLQYEFLKVPVKDIRHVLNHFRFHYVPSHKCLADGLAQANLSKSNVLQTLQHNTQTAIDIYKSTKTFIQLKLGPSSYNMKLLSHGRNHSYYKLLLCDRLQQEVDFMKAELQKENQEVDRCAAISACVDEYAQAGQMIECGCCYGEFVFDLMIQCLEGHLFCRGCIESYTREAVFGQGKSNLMCLSDGCETFLPKSQLRIALSSELLTKYEDRVEEEDLNLANLEDLVRCPHCHFAAIMDPDDKVFQCQGCFKETCRYCQLDWSDHFGIPCREMEKKDETKIRLDFEEKMSQAKIRMCHRCKASFMKSDGCNKMTCRCGAKMCYICRKPDIGYNHFCQHVRDPGKACKTCTSCSLWTQTDEDDERALQELKKEAQRTRRDQGFVEEKLIGATTDTPAKRRRLDNPAK